MEMQKRPERDVGDGQPEGGGARQFRIRVAAEEGGAAILQAADAVKCRFDPAFEPTNN